MSIAKLYEQTWPGLMQDADKSYNPKPSDLYPMVIMKPLTQSEIDKAIRRRDPLSRNDENKNETGKA